jgi:hypothetical protein
VSCGKRLPLESTGSALGALWECSRANHSSPERSGSTLGVLQSKPLFSRALWERSGSAPEQTTLLQSALGALWECSRANHSSPESSRAPREGSLLQSTPERLEQDPPSPECSESALGALQRRAFAPERSQSKGSSLERSQRCSERSKELQSKRLFSRALPEHSRNASSSPECSGAGLFALGALLERSQEGGSCSGTFGALGALECSGVLQSRT